MPQRRAAGGDGRGSARTKRVQDVRANVRGAYGRGVAAFGQCHRPASADSNGRCDEPPHPRLSDSPGGDRCGSAAGSDRPDARLARRGGLRTSALLRVQRLGPWGKQYHDAERAREYVAQQRLPIGSLHPGHPLQPWLDRHRPALRRPFRRHPRTPLLRVARVPRRKALQEAPQSAAGCTTARWRLREPLSARHPTNPYPVTDPLSKEASCEPPESADSRPSSPLPP